MKWLRFWHREHASFHILQMDIRQLRADLYMHGQRINIMEKAERYIMKELDNLKSAVAANKTATDAAILRVEAKLAAAAMVVPAELEALSVDLAASTAKLDELAKDHGNSMGGLTE